MSNVENKLLIYLGDFVHNYIDSRDIWTIPLNIADIAAYTNKFFHNQVVIKIFKFADIFIEAMKKNKPDIVGVSNYIWNYELSKTIISKAKEINPDCITVMGGANVTQTEKAMEEEFKSFPLDFYVSFFGEDPFKCICEAVLFPKFEKNEIFKDLRVHGVWYLDPETKKPVQKKVLRNITNLDEIPSPYTGGYLDESFENDLMPMIETNRGCPFECTFCDWGVAGLGRISKFSIDRVKKDIRYIQMKSSDERLMINDANFGILGNRDLEIAKFINNMNKRTGFPNKLVVTWSQSKNKTTLRIGEQLKSFFMVTTSFQSMNPRTLSAIKRKNINDEQFKRNMEFCKYNNIETYGELMVPLPHESIETFFEAIRYYFGCDIDFININPLILLKGAELNEPSARKEFGFKTKWRLMENCYGFYDGTPVIEYQEMVIESKTMPWDEFILCRPISWLIHMSWNLRRHDLLLRFLQSIGINPLDFLLKVIAEYKEKADPKVAQIFNDFWYEARNEYHSSKEELLEFYSQPKNLERLKNGGFRKLNIHYAGRVSIECPREFVEYYRIIAKDILEEKQLDNQKHLDFVDDCCEYQYGRFLNFDELSKIAKGIPVGKKLNMKSKVHEWGQLGKSIPIDEYVTSDTVEYYFYIESNQKNILRKHLTRFSGASEEYQMSKLQETVHGMHKNNLLFQVRQENPRITPHESSRCREELI